MAHPLLEDTHVSLGGDRPFKRLARTWKNKNTNVLSKLLGTALWPIFTAQTVLSRGDHYDPFADSAVLYHNDPAVMKHELGHALDFKKRKYPGGYAALRQTPFVQLPVIIAQEMAASRHAARAKMKEILADGKITEDEHKNLERQGRVLGGGFGSYAGTLAARIPPLAPAALPLMAGSVVGGQILGKGTKWLRAEEMSEILRAMDEIKARKKRNKNLPEGEEPESLEYELKDNLTDLANYGSETKKE
jgi:hypothetical protein